MTLFAQKNRTGRGILRKPDRFTPPVRPNTEDRNFPLRTCIPSKAKYILDKLGDLSNPAGIPVGLAADTTIH